MPTPKKIFIPGSKNTLPPNPYLGQDRPTLQNLLITIETQLGNLTTNPKGSENAIKNLQTQQKQIHDALAAA